MLEMLSISNKNTNDFTSLFFFKIYNIFVSYFPTVRSNAAQINKYKYREIIIITIAGESKIPTIFIVLIIFLVNKSSF